MAGWKAAELSGNGSYRDLFSVYNFATDNTNDYGIHLAPLSLVRAGYYIYDGGSLYDRGSRGRYWESMVQSSTSARDLDFYSTRLTPQNVYEKGYGFSLRCLVR